MKFINKIKRVFTAKDKAGFSSMDYWENRYSAGGNSGSGSYNELALFKAEVINQLLDEHNIHSVIEFGVGDGNQLSLMKYRQYLGLDVSGTAIKNCIKKFNGDDSKSFMLYDPACFVNNDAFLSADLVLSLDVIYHLIENNIYKKYINDIFSAGSKMVIIYSTNESLPQFSGHEKHRNFTADIERDVPEWRLLEVIMNEYSIEKYGEERGSRANFYIYIKK